MRIPEEDGKAKLVVSAWDDAYGAFPADMHVALSHWGAENGYMQTCGAVSGEAINAFMDATPTPTPPSPTAPSPRL